MIINWNGKILVNGTEVQNGFDTDSVSGKIQIELFPVSAQTPVKEEAQPATQPIAPVKEREGDKVYRIMVKPYMTRKAEPGFDFMAKWNKDIPMPLRMMTGTIVKETRGMVYMSLHGEMYAQRMCTCMACGRKLTNPVSQYFGIGPECGGHNYVNPFEDEEQLKEAVSEYQKKLQAITWEGWIIRSAIIEQEEV